MPTSEQLSFIERHRIKPVYRPDGTWDGHTVSIGTGTLTEALWELVKGGHYAKCSFPGCDAPGSHPHHICYPQPVKPLCPCHHREITIINCNHVRYNRAGFPKKLSDKQRWFLWYGWLEGRIQPVETPAALKYLESFRETRD